MIYNEPLTLETPQELPGKNRNIRLQIFLSVFVVLFAGVVFSLVKLQVVDSQTYLDKARKQYELRTELPATRGSICDRNGEMLASNTFLFSYAADPKGAGDSLRNHIADVFSEAFGTSKDFFMKKLKPKSRFVWLARLVDPETLHCKIPEHLAGITISKEPKRLYYHKTAAGQIVGTTNIDNRGIMGLELALNEKLEGKQGFIVKQKDGLGGERPEVEYPKLDPVNGNTVFLTIDLELQFIAEEELRNGVEKNNAEGGLVIMMNPKTGEILAAAQYPPLDPGEPSASNQKDQKLKFVTDRVEPGSVFKIVTASAAFEHHLVTADQLFSAENGKWVVPIGRGRVRKIVDDHPHGIVTVKEAMEVSSNIVMAKISNIIGAERFYKMARAYGFGSPTNVELPGEVRGFLNKPSLWSKTSLNTMAFGYEVSVTPLQLACAYSVIANGGYLMKPYIVEKEVDPSGQLVSETHPQTIRRVISDETDSIMTELFEGVVDSGTATAVRIAGLRIAGKTGTAKRNINGHYEPGKYTASFVGFYPVEEPKVVCLVMLDNPKGGSYYGGLTSGPVFKAIAERVISTTEICGNIQLRKAVGANVALNTTVPEKPKKENARVENRANDGMMIQPNVEHSPEERIVPDVHGYSVRKAVNLLSNGQLEAVVQGFGVVIGQEPVAGMVVRPGTKVIIKCEPKAISVQTQGLN